MVYTEFYSTYTHLVLDGVLGAEDLGEGVASEGVPESGLGKETSCVGRIVDEFDGCHWIPNPELDNGVHVDRHTVLGQDLNREHNTQDSTSTPPH